MPRVGGWLAVLNCAIWALLIFLGQCALLPELGQATTVFTKCCLWIFGFPLLWTMDDFAPQMGQSRSFEIVVISVIGINSFVWGYGLVLIERLFVLIGRRRKVLNQLRASSR